MRFDTLSECREVPRSSEFRVSNIFGVFEELDDVDHHVTRSEWPVKKNFFARASVSMTWDSNSMPRASVCTVFDAHQKPGISRVKCARSVQKKEFSLPLIKRFKIPCIHTHARCMHTDDFIQIFVNCHRQH